ncbi:protein-methionine-sulfoxide reductase heme-binding subunit MsrQ [Tropicimonas sp. TH_r6]|uniref:protein-methionine-sulfoxide reductase heme-binding subunit MsrQ n=1 Tax=Tropicimonas sp. TH_r6 TaxID=3082085 RepID=UPI002952B6EC|nr:protein-methionine-sulfoxide reductase heme-binding subunit MsrQ [Tropicimonas sp. TH_r6]MDV7143144.1 protein-methionine-sulfoxide reductase heme-binding subunit MsrQ [Tropicimonas sp. TH_r6]
MALVDGMNGVVKRLPSWPLYPLGAVPVVWLFWQGLTGGLGVDPTKVIEHQLGLWGLWLLIAGLAITPLQRFAGLRLIKFRRAIGLLAFFYILTHLLVWLVLDVQIPAQIWADILKRPYITIGMAAFLMMVPLAITSNNWSLRKLGPVRWRALHKLTYLLVPLGAVHFVMVVKGWQMEPLYYLAGVVALLALRLRPSRRRGAAAA